jgi:hypothetical protein
MASTATAAAPASAQGSLRQRKKGVSPAPPDDAADADDKAVLAKALAASKPPSEIDYHVGFVVMTALAFLTRFWGISHPNEVVFDEVHFGKVGAVALSLLGGGSHLLTAPTVRVLLPRADVLLRRAPSPWQAAVRVHGLARRLRRPVPL